MWTHCTWRYNSPFGGKNRLTPFSELWLRCHLVWKSRLFLVVHSNVGINSYVVRYNTFYNTRIREKELSPSVKVKEPAKSTVAIPRFTCSAIWCSAVIGHVFFVCAHIVVFHCIKCKSNCVFSYRNKYRWYCRKKVIMIVRSSKRKPRKELYMVELKKWAKRYVHAALNWALNVAANEWIAHRKYRL